MPPTGAKSSPKNQIDHTHLHSFVADLPLAMKTAGALNQTAVRVIPNPLTNWLRKSGALRITRPTSTT
jgi:hypothetical protein